MYLAALVALAQKYLGFVRQEFVVFIAGLAIALSVYAATYVFSSRAQRSPRGMLDYMFPRTAFGRARIDFLVLLIGKLAWAPLFVRIIVFVGFEALSLQLFNAAFGERTLVAAQSWPMLLVQFLILFFASSFAFYWAHRAMHEIPLLWSFHRAHHSAEALSSSRPDAHIRLNISACRFGFR